MHKSCKSCTKNKIFLQHVNILQDSCKIFQDNFLQDFDQIFEEKYFTFFLQKFWKIFISCIQSFIFSARLARYVQVLMQDLESLVRKIRARLTYFLQDGFYWEWRPKIYRIPECVVSSFRKIGKVSFIIKWVPLPCKIVYTL